MNGLTLVALIAIAVAIVFAYRAGAMRVRRSLPMPPLTPARAPTTSPVTTIPATPEPESAADRDDRLDAERFRLVLAYEDEAHRARVRLDACEAEAAWLRELRDDRTKLHGDLANARAETARYRQIVVDIENNAPPPLLESPTAPDDLKLIVGIGPVLERMLQQLGISTYRQVARWTERDIDEFDARLHEFRGRIRRDDWVTQARALHQSKYGENALSRERS